VVAAFDGGAITSDAGALLLREADRAIGLIDRVAACFEDHRDPDAVVHAVRTLVGQRIVGIACGYEDINEHDQLRFDPVLSLFSGGLEAKRKDRAPLAGKSTVNRLEHALGGGEDRYHKISHDAAALETVFVDVFLDVHAKRRLWFSSFAYVLIRALQRIGLPHTELAQATCGTIRLKVLKLGARRRQARSAAPARASASGRRVVAPQRAGGNRRLVHGANNRSGQSICYLNRSIQFVIDRRPN
jgi:hypothetical protein